MRPIPLVLACAMCASPAFSQLHLLTGSPFSLGQAVFPSALLRVGDDGTVRKIADIVQPPLGTEWIGVSYEWRKAVVLASWENAVIVVDFDKAAVTKKCKPPDPAGRIYMYSWLADAPAPGPSFEWLETGTDVVRDAVVWGMVLDPAVPCEKSFGKLEPEAVRYAVAHGAPGIADVVNSDGIRTVTNEDGPGTVAVWMAGKHVPLGYDVPLALLRGMEVKGEGMVINDSHVFILLMADEKGNRRDLVFRKSDNTWHTFPRPDDDIRGFGRYIATAEVLRTANARNTRSAGMEKWKAGRDGVRPDLREHLKAMNEHMPISYPGRLHLYDVDTEQLFTINTGQGDSEVLLVESGVVYYRAADELYSAPITDRGIGPARLLATDDSIRDAHWAFIKY